MDDRSAASAPRSNSQAPELAVQARPSRQRSVAAGLSAFIGYLLLIVGLLIGLVFSLHLPWLVAAGVPDPSAAREFEQNIGPNWPSLVECIGWIVTGALLVLSMLFLILARRRRDLGHLIRAVAGISLLTVFLFCMALALPGREAYLSPAFRARAATDLPGPILAEALRSVHIPFLVCSVAALIVGLTVLAWPAADRAPGQDALAYSKVASPARR